MWPRKTKPMSSSYGEHGHARGSHHLVDRLKSVNGQWGKLDGSSQELHWRRKNRFRYGVEFSGMYTIWYETELMISQTQPKKLWRKAAENLSLRSHHLSPNGLPGTPSRLKGFHPSSWDTILSAVQIHRSRRRSKGVGKWQHIGWLRHETRAQCTEYKYKAPLRDTFFSTLNQLHMTERSLLEH